MHRCHGSEYSGRVQHLCGSLRVIGSSYIYCFDFFVFAHLGI